MVSGIRIVLIILVLSCCKTNEKVEQINKVLTNYNEKNFDIDSMYNIGDSRRYRIYPDSLNNRLNPRTGKSLIISLLDFAEENEVDLFFSKGYYGLNLILDSRNNINMYFNKAEFNLLYITNERGSRSSRINLKGTLILYDRFGTYYSDSIKADSIIIKSNTIKNLSKSKSRGCHIYKGTNNLFINYLQVEDLASGDLIYQNNHAALAIDGLRENPTNITINEVIINSSDRHGAYITGTNIVIPKMTINNYGQGTTKFMTGMQDSGKGEEKVLSGLWINRCNSCIFDSVQIQTKNSIKGFPLKLDEGISDKPTFINNLILDVPYEDEIVLDDIFTNVLVKKISILD